MTFDLAAARALHDRDPEAPHACATCRDRTGLGFDWPCATATALGATGRSEWTGPHNRCHHTDTHGGTCIWEAGHEGLHVHLRTAGDQPQPPTLCGDAIGIRTCSLPSDHDGPHDRRVPTGAQKTAGTDRCPSTSPGGFPCEGDRHHAGHHRYAPGDNNHPIRWSRDPCDEPSIIPNDPPRWCILNRGHEGPCYFATGGSDIDRCTATNGTAHCALGNGHNTASGHLNMNGLPITDPQCGAVHPRGTLAAACTRPHGHDEPHFHPARGYWCHSYTQ